MAHKINTTAKTRAIVAAARNNGGRLDRRDVGSVKAVVIVNQISPYRLT
jgi:hypothetical protein